MTDADLDSRYLELWKRMDRVARNTKDPREVDYLMADFFLNFEDIAELERHVEIAEHVAHEEGATTESAA